MTNNLSKLSLDNIRNSDSHKELAEQVINKIKNDEVDIIDVNLFLNKIRKVSELVNKDKEIKDRFLTEFLKLKEDKKKSVEFGTNKVTLTSRSYYDFKECNDPVLEKLYKIQSRVKELVKVREDELKKLHIDNSKSFSIKDSKIIVDVDYELIEKEVETEIFIVNPPVKGGKDVFSYKV